MTKTNNIIELNRDLEPFIIQGASNRSASFGDKHKPLQFVHCSDMHARPDHWNRMIEFINYYKDYIQFAIHSGDYCGGHQGVFADMYHECDECLRPIYNCVGNHDTMPPDTSTGDDIGTAPRSEVHRMLFGDQYRSWDANFMECEYSTAYFRDFTDSNIRMIVLDHYYNIEEQKLWLKALLDEAMEKQIHVITVIHEPSANITEPVETNFHSINKWRGENKTKFEDTISDFVKRGGILVANLAGHTHHDFFGYTAGGVLNSVVESGTSWKYWCDADRVEGTRTFDAFNVMSVDTDLGILKLIRVGNNTDNFLREKKVFCYDYLNKKIITGRSTV